VPGLGEALSARDAATAATRGDYIAAGASALAANPFWPAPAAMRQSMDGGFSTRAYHGTREPWQGSKFDERIAHEKQDVGGGDFNLSTDPEYASGYAGDFDGANVMAGDVQFKNPYHHIAKYDLDQAEVEILLDKAKAHGHDGLVIDVVYDPKYGGATRKEIVPIARGTVRNAYSGRELYGLAPLGILSALALVDDEKK
jgi:hypothetical protein